MGIGFVGWLGLQNRDVLIPFLTSANYIKLASSFLGYIGSLGAVLLGWAAIMRSFSSQLDWWTHTQIYCSTLVARRLPGTLWYVGGRLLLYKKLGVSQKLVSIASSIELVASILTGSLMSLVLLLSGVDLPSQAMFLFFAGTLIGFFLLNPRLLKRLARWSNLSQVEDIHLKDVLKLAVGLFRNVGIGWINACSDHQRISCSRNV